MLTCKYKYCFREHPVYMMYMKHKNGSSLSGKLFNIVNRFYNALSEPVQPTPRGFFLYMKMTYVMDEPVVQLYNAYEYKDYLKQAGFVFDGKAWCGTPEMLTQIAPDILERMINSINRNSLLDSASDIANYLYSLVKK